MNHSSVIDQSADVSFHSQVILSSLKSNASGKKMGPEPIDDLPHRDNTKNTLITHRRLWKTFL